MTFLPAGPREGPLVQICDFQLSKLVEFNFKAFVHLDPPVSLLIGDDSKTAAELQIPLEVEEGITPGRELLYRIDTGETEIQLPNPTGSGLYSKRVRVGRWMTAKGWAVLKAALEECKITFVVIPHPVKT